MPYPALWKARVNTEIIKDRRGKAVHCLSPIAKPPAFGQRETVDAPSSDKDKEKQIINVYALAGAGKILTIGLS